MSPKFKTHPLGDAQILARQVLRSVERYTTRRTIAGSIRRERPTVHDIDIVVIPKPLMFPSHIANSVCMSFGFQSARLERGGPKILFMKVRGVDVSLYNSNEVSWGIHLLRWTGSADHNIKLARRARRLGLRLAVSKGVTTPDGEIIASRTEEDVFRALDMAFIRPQDREVAESERIVELPRSGDP